MKKKIVFFDIDGTLSTEDTFTIPESTRKAIQLARENGHLMFINTGRCFSCIEEQIKDLNMDGYICGCGTQIIYNNESIFRHTLDQDLRRRIIQTSMDTCVENILEGAHGTYYPPVVKDPLNRIFRQRYIDQGFPVFTYHREDDVEFDKMALWFYPDSDIEHFKKTFNQELDFIRRADNFYEIVPLGYSKASGIQKILDILDMDIEDTLSIGDSTNDLPMLTYTKESIAMGNANPVILDSVTYITTDINDDGVYNALKHFKLI